MEENTTKTEPTPPPAPPKHTLTPEEQKILEHRRNKAVTSPSSPK